MRRRQFLRLGARAAAGTAAALLAARLPAGEPGPLRYQGTHILTHGALRRLAGEYNRLGPERLVVSGGGCDDGITATRNGSADLGGMCCPVAGSRAEGLLWLPVARDIKTVVAHPSLPLETIALQDLREIARGRIRRWDRLGGPRRPVALVVRRHCAQFFEPVRHLLLDDRPAWSPRALFVDTDQQLVDAVARYRASIGLVSRVFAQPLIDSGRLKPLRVDGVPPGLTAARAGDYPLTGPLNLVFERWDAPRMRPFFDFLYSAAGARIIAGLLVPVSAEAAGYEALRNA